MYGLVNRAIESLIVDEHGEETWHQVLMQAGLETAGFVGMDPYPDEVTYRLVFAAAEVLQAPAETLLEAFGEYWILYTAREGYGELLAASGDSFGEFLENLDDLHARVALAFPDLNPPRFGCDETEPGVYRVRYDSDREGLVPMVVGLLKGLAKRFHLHAEVVLCEDQPGTIFTVHTTASEVAER